MDKDKFKKMLLSELFMLIRNGSSAISLSASEEIERRLSELEEYKKLYNEAANLLNSANNKLSQISTLANRQAG